MNCRKFTKYLYLHKPGENKPRMEKKLRNHLAECDNCKETLNQITINEIIYKKLRDEKPQAENAKLLTDKIIQNIEDEKHKYEQETDIIELFASWFYKPIVKYSFLFVLLPMIGSFFFQQIRMTNSIAKLENQVENYSPAEYDNNIRSLNGIKQINSNNNKGRFYSYLKFFSLKKSIRRLGIINRIAIYAEINKSPELMDFFRTENFNDSNLQYLFESNNDVVLKINEIITKGRN